MPKTRHLGLMASYAAIFKDRLNAYAINTFLRGLARISMYTRNSIK